MQVTLLHSASHGSMGGIVSLPLNSPSIPHTGLNLVTVCLVAPLSSLPSSQQGLTKFFPPGHCLVSIDWTISKNKYFTWKKDVMLYNFVRFWRILKIYFLVFMCASAVPEWMYVHHMCAWCPWMSDYVTYTRTRAMGGCEPTCRYWELNLGPLKEQQILLTIQSSLQSLILNF